VPCNHLRLASHDRRRNTVPPYSFRVSSVLLLSNLSTHSPPPESGALPTTNSSASCNYFRLDSHEQALHCWPPLQLPRFPTAISRLIHSPPPESDDAAPPTSSSSVVSGSNHFHLSSDEQRRTDSSYSFRVSAVLLLSYSSTHSSPPECGALPTTSSSSASSCNLCRLAPHEQTLHWLPLQLPRVFSAAQQTFDSLSFSRREWRLTNYEAALNDKPVIHYFRLLASSSHERVPHRLLSQHPRVVISATQLVDSFTRFFLSVAQQHRQAHQ